MIGDKLLIEDYHIAAANFVIKQLEKLKPGLSYSLSVSGESGSGKSEIALVLAQKFEEQGKKVLVLGQDDYFKLPPHANHKQRKKDIGWVGTGEVKLDMLNEHVKKLLTDSAKIEKPLVHFKEDIIEMEIINGPFDIVIAEGTYTALLKDVDIHVFIDRDYKETKRHRLSRNRDQSLENNKDKDLNFLENVLRIEHKIIREHKKLAQIVIPPPEILLS